MIRNIITKNGLTYSRQGDYFLPDLKLPPQQELNIGLYGKKEGNSLRNIIELNTITCLPA